MQLPPTSTGRGILGGNKPDSGFHSFVDSVHVAAAPACVASWLPVPAWLPGAGCTSEELGKAVCRARWHHSWDRTGGPGALVLLREHLLLALLSLETHSWKQLLLKLGHRWPWWHGTVTAVSPGVEVPQGCASAAARVPASPAAFGLSQDLRQAVPALPGIHSLPAAGGSGGGSQPRGSHLVSPIPSPGLERLLHGALDPV